MLYDSLDDDTHPHALELASFCQSTSLMTSEGAQPVDWLRAGDRVVTKDHGLQKILWAGRTIAAPKTLASIPEMQPVRIKAHSIDGQIPTQDLLLSPEHRVLLKSPQIDLMFATDEVMAPIKAFENGDDIAQIRPGHTVSYFHILFKNHELVLAEGLWVESFIPDKTALACLSADAQAEIHALLGAKTDTMETARMCLKPWEAQLLPSHDAAQSAPQLFVA